MVNSKYFWRDFPTWISRLVPTPLPFNALNEGIPSSYLILISHGITRMAGLQFGEGRMMIDSVVWTQSVHQRDRHTDRQTDSHVAIANVAPT